MILENCNTNPGFQSSGKITSLCMHTLVGSHFCHKNLSIYDFLLNYQLLISMHTLQLEYICRPWPCGYRPRAHHNSHPRHCMWPCHSSTSLNPTSVSIAITDDVLNFFTTLCTTTCNHEKSTVNFLDS